MHYAKTSIGYLSKEIVSLFYLLQLKKRKEKEKQDDKTDQVLSSNFDQRVWEPM